VPRKTALDKLVERVDRGETVVSDDDEIIEVEMKPRRSSVVVPVRIPSDRWADLRREADEIGVGPSTLLRIWVLERLRRKKARSA
jgi:hypothetical protein